MASLTHNAYRAYRSSGVSSLSGRSSMKGVAMIAVCASLAAAAAWAAVGSGEPAAMAKGDRLAAHTSVAAKGDVGASVYQGGIETRRDQAGRVVFVRDEANRTTSVAKGASIPLSERSPYGAEQ